jgi:HAE1 family hydrophobic/amphiphilic exporter-1
MFGLILFGVISFNRMGVSQLPDVDFPNVGVSLTMPGAAPEVIESQVVDPIEDAIMQIDGIRNISSTSSQSSGSISVEFDLNRNIDEAVQEVQNRIAQVQNVLPTGLMPASVRKSNPEDAPILWLAVMADDEVKPIDAMIYARNVLYNQFASVPGVGDIAFGGYTDPTLRVWLDNNKLKEYELTAGDVISTIQAEHVEVPAGKIENSNRESNVRLMGEANTAEEFGKLRVNGRTGGANYKPIPLANLGVVEEGIADIRKISRFNGKHAVGLGILKQHGANAVDVADLVRARLQEIETSIPKQYKVSIRSDSTRFIKQSVNELTFMLILSAALTSIVCFFFLGSWTSTINVLMSIPTSIVGAFTALYFFGFTLNTFTLLGLSLAIGIVVDDAIMMLENIVRHRELGESKRSAALKGSKEITFAALAATVAVVAIFLPVIFIKGIIGRYFFQYGITVSVAVLLSLLEALTLTPMRCSRYLEISHKKSWLDKKFVKLNLGYENLLAKLLNHRWKTLLAALLLFSASLYIAKLLPGEMMPAQDQSQFMLRIKGPVGSAIEWTDAEFKKIEDYLANQPVVDSYFTAVGGFGGDAVNQGMIFVTLVDPGQRKERQAEVIKRFRDELKNKVKKMKVVAQDLSLRGFSSSRGFPIEFIVQGPNWDKLVAGTQALVEAIDKSGVAADANIDIQDGMPEYQLIPDREKLATHGVSFSNVTNAINVLIGGAILNGQTEYPKAGHRYPIEVRLKPEQRNRSAQMQSVRVGNNRGEVISLSDLVKIEERPGLQLITRLNRTRSISVYANVAGKHSQQQALKAIEELAPKVLPAGYYIQMTGSAQSFRESFQSLILALLLGILVSYMVLATQFNSFIHPLSVLLALPFSISGAFLALLICHQSINIYSLIGLILLMGLVKKNSILLVDFTNHVRSNGEEDVKGALLKACPVRLRPIIMTSTATIAGCLPEALSIGPGAETTIPMAIAIIGGVLASTVLTLFIVPCAYSLLSALERKQNFMRDSSASVSNANDNKNSIA